MSQKIKKIVLLSIVLMISFVFSRCQNDENLSNPEVAKVSVAKQWFKEYESTGNNLELFQNLNYEWTKAEVKDSNDGVQLIIVPIAEVKKDQSEIWEQRLYIYKLNDNNYKALLYEFYPDDTASLDSNNFNGYITAWDLKSGFVRSAKFENDKIVENGDVEILSKDKLVTGNTTAKVPQESNFDGDTSNPVSPGIYLRPVLVQNNYIDSIYYNPRGKDITGGNSQDYTSGYTGGGGSGSNSNSTTVTAPPSCESFNFTSKKGANWQEAVVKNIYFRIIILDNKGIYVNHVVSFPQGVLFGMPINLNKGNGDISGGVAATVSAMVLNKVMNTIDKKYARTEVSDLILTTEFKSLLTSEYSTYTNGGKVNFNSTSSLPAANYKTNANQTGICD